MPVVREKLGNHLGADDGAGKPDVETAVVKRGGWKWGIAGPDYDQYSLC